MNVQTSRGLEAIRNDAKLLLSQLAASADAGTLQEDYGTQGVSIVLRRIYYLLDHAA